MKKKKKYTSRKKPRPCYWCGEILKTFSYRRFLSQEGKKFNYAFFCDLVCEECYVYNKRVEDPEYVGAPIGHYSYERQSERKCETCQLKGKAKELPFKLVDKNKETNKTRRLYFCSEGCMGEFLENK